MTNGTIAMATVTVKIIEICHKLKHMLPGGGYDDGKQLRLLGIRAHLALVLPLLVALACSRLTSAAHLKKLHR
jgi:hypothetical protein